MRHPLNGLALGLAAALLAGAPGVGYSAADFESGRGRTRD